MVWVLVAQLCPTPCNSMECSLPGSSMEFSRLEYWVGGHFLLQGIFLTQELYSKCTGQQIKYGHNDRGSETLSSQNAGLKLLLDGPISVKNRRPSRVSWSVLRGTKSGMKENLGESEPSLPFSRYVVPDSLQPHGLQHTREVIKPFSWQTGLEGAGRLRRQATVCSEWSLLLVLLRKKIEYISCQKFSF